MRKELSVEKSWTVSSQSKAMAAGDVSAMELANVALGLAADKTVLNAIVSLDPEIVRQQAAASDVRRKSGKLLSEIDGVCIAVKDNFWTKDYPTTACSNAAPIYPENVDSSVVEKLRSAGAVIFAKTNMHEWAYGATNGTSSIGPTRNPHNVEHITGGSSGGSAAVVAAGIVPAALGSDTGGSVRIPSGACGIYGFKPSYGRASRHGVLPLSWSLDAPGLMATTLHDLELLLPYFIGADQADRTTIHSKPYTSGKTIEHPRLVNLVGTGLERSEEVDATLNQALRQVQAFAEIQIGEIPDLGSYFAAWEAILHAEATSFHAEQLANDPSGYSSVTRSHLEAGKLLSATELLKAQQLRTEFCRAIDELLKNADALVLPTLPVTAPKLGEDWQEFGNLRVTSQDSMTWFCWLGNLAGLPCLSIPCGLSSAGLPVGMMLMGRAGEDEKLFNAARKLDLAINP